MKKLLSLISVFFLALLVMGQGYNVKNYTEQGGERTVVGGSLDVVSGGDLDIESGGALKIGGTAISSTATQLNYISSATGTTGTATTNIVFSTSPTLVTPALGTPSALVLTNATGLPVSTGITGFGTGIAAALAVNTGSAGAPVLYDGAGGTPSAITLTNGTGLPVSTGVSGLGTGIAAALAINTGSAGAPVLFDGALGTPSSGTLTNATGLPVASGISGLGTGVATALAVNTGSTGAVVVDGGAAVLTNITGTGKLSISSTIAGGASPLHLIQQTNNAGETYSGTSAILIKNYDADATVVHDGGENAGLGVWLKVLSAPINGGEHALATFHNHSSSTAVVKHGIVIYGDLTNGLSISGGTSTNGIYMENQTVTNEIMFSNGTVLITGSATTRAEVRADGGDAAAIGSQYNSSAGKIYFKVANTTADTDWEKVTTTAAD